MTTAKPELKTQLPGTKLAEKHDVSDQGNDPRPADHPAHVKSEQPQPTILSVDGKITLTMDELKAMVSQQVAQAFGTARAAQSGPALEELPTLEEAKTMAEERISRSEVPSSILTKEGHYVHPLVGGTVEQLHSYIDHRHKQAERIASAKSAAAGSTHAKAA